MFFAKNKIRPIADVVNLCASIITVILSISQNAPLGVGTACNAIHELMTLVQTCSDNKEQMIMIISDIRALCPILDKLTDTLSLQFDEALANLTEQVKSITAFIKTHKEMNKLKRILLARKFEQQIVRSITHLQVVKLTMTLAMTAQFADPEHVIPATDHRSACQPLTSLSSLGDNRCMIVSGKTGLRCSTLFPRYALISRAAGCKVIYHACGNCAKQCRNAWWKAAYTRVDRGGDVTNSQ